MWNSTRTGRGTDLRLEQNDRVGAAERKAMHRLRRGLEVEGHELDEADIERLRAQLAAELGE